MHLSIELIIGDHYIVNLVALCLFAFNMPDWMKLIDWLIISNRVCGGGGWEKTLQWAEHFGWVYSRAPGLRRTYHLVLVYISSALSPQTNWLCFCPFYNYNFEVQPIYFVLTRLLHFSSSVFPLFHFLVSLFFPNLLPDCTDRLYRQLEKNRVLSSELRLALNED